MRDLAKERKLVKLPSVAMQGHVQILEGTPFKYRAAYANRPTPPKKKWVWGISEPERMF